MAQNRKIIIFGSGAAGINPARKPSCSGLYDFNEVIIFDIGYGGIVGINSVPFINLSNIKYIFISHFHQDHCGDLPNFIFLINLPYIKPPQELNIVGPKGLNNLWNGLYNAWGSGVTGRQFKLNLIELDAGEYNIGNYKIKTIHLPHKEESIAYRINWFNKDIIYSGDTEYCEDLIEFCRDADYAILECTNIKAPARKGHMSASDVGKVAKLSNIKNLIPIHFSYQEDNAVQLKEAIGKYYSGCIIIPDDGTSIDIYDSNIS